MIDVLVGLPGASPRRSSARSSRRSRRRSTRSRTWSTSTPFTASGGMIIVRFLVGTTRPGRSSASGEARRAGAVAPPGALPRRSPHARSTTSGPAWTSGRTTSPGRAPAVADELSPADPPPPGRAGDGTRRAAPRRPRHVRPDRLAATTLPRPAYQALSGLNWRLPAGSFSTGNTETLVEVGSLFRARGRRLGRRRRFSGSRSTSATSRAWRRSEEASQLRLMLTREAPTPPR